MIKPFFQIGQEFFNRIPDFWDFKNMFTLIGVKFQIVKNLFRNIGPSKPYSKKLVFSWGGIIT